MPHEYRAGPPAAPRFKFGRTFITRGALAALTDLDVFGALRRHGQGDWGNLDAHDRAENEWALVHGERLLSKYRAESGTDFYVITERDRSATTVLLPAEY